jgi:hypothetical protein
MAQSRRTIPLCDDFASERSAGAPAMKTPSRFSAPARRRAHGLAAIMLPVAFFALLALAPSGAWAQAAVAPASGDGATTDTAYQITKLGNLAWLHDMAAASSTGSTYYKLMNDIDASATATWNDNGTTTTLVGFNPIGNVSDPFKGVFDGAGHKITGLVINRSSMDGVGLFGFIKSGGEASHLGLVGGSVTGNSYVGGLVGNNYAGMVSACYATGAVTGNSYVGGLVGNNYAGTVTESYATGAVTGNSYVGGLVGVNSYDATVSNCHATGAASGIGFVGGLVGYSYNGTVSACYATGAVTGSANSVGGLVGINDGGTVTKSYATGAASGSYYDVGGLVGTNSGGTVSACYATGAASGIGSIGGLVGYSYNDGTVSACYATGAVTGSGGEVGGLVGYNNNGTVSACYATGAVTGTSYAGGLVGYSYGRVSDSYWNTETTGQSSSDGGTDATTVQMKQQATFTGWDFTTVWGIQGSYPCLRGVTVFTLTYAAGENGSILGVSPQAVHFGESGTAVRAMPVTGYLFARWSDGSTANPRADANVTADVSVTATFKILAAAREWLGYR